MVGKVNAKCCYQCTKRVLGCHATCDDYKAFKGSIPPKYTEAEIDYSEYTMESNRRWRSQKGLRKGLKKSRGGQ